ncbi:MAG TPA: sulfate adenylyltransferase subunit CysN [Solirubrobacteraceae bacterium]|jgi:bifunctional enzyme CysN/CysC|nr:sulfate adenylyltransferase subunit CysN [Solirubrobacteraceae bacterium]
MQAAGDIDAYLAAHEQKSLLRFITCGSVDDGKSTLIGRLLYESKLVFEDQLAALKDDSAKLGTQGGELDLALLVDGLQAEREQGITIDVAYRFFSTDTRKFIVADTPGHEQYTRNMVTGASTADAAVILIDARSGILTQTRRHSYLVALLGIPSVAVAVNKLDLVSYSRATFREIERAYRDFADEVGLRDVTCIPVSALKGDNVLERSPNTPWYDGPTLMEYLESVETEDAQRSGPFRMPVQWVNRPDLSFRGFAGVVVGGSIAPGDPVRVLPGAGQTTVARIVTRDGDLPQAVAGQSITLTLSDEIDVSRGDVIASAVSPPAVADQFEADLIWMSEEPLTPGKHYLLKLGTKTVGASIAQPKHRVEVNTMQRLAAKTLGLNEIGVVTVTLDRQVPFDPYAENRDMGAFILIDRLSNDTIAAGMLHFALRRSQNVHWQSIEVSKAARVAMNHHGAGVVWLTGLSGAGKSTLANVIERKLHASGVRTFLLDGDNIRHGLNKDLGFTEADRIENVRRVAEVSKLMVQAGLVVLVSFISPFRADRQLAREMHELGEFCEVHVDTPLAVAEARDTKGLYAKARRGELRHFTGIDSPYEPPESPDVWIDTTVLSAEQAADRVIAKLTELGILEP